MKNPCTLIVIVGVQECEKVRLVWVYHRQVDDARRTLAEQRIRAKAGMTIPTPDYRGLATAPGFVVP